MKTLRLPLLVLALSLLLSGCEPSCEKLAEQTASIELGTGFEDFEVVADGDALEPAWGNQGGQHIWSSLRASGVHRGYLIGTDARSVATRPTVRFSLESDGDTLALYSTENQAVTHLGDGSGEVIGATAFINLNPYDTPQFFPEDFDPDDWESWEEGENEAAWTYAQEMIEGMDWLFTVTLTDSCGTEVSDSRTVRIEGL
jgi:hypothetical protein